jgi:histidinol-phosphatase
MKVSSTVSTCEPYEIDSPAVSATRDLQFAHQLADIADAITMGHFLRTDLRVDLKADATPVTEADTSVERAIREQVRQHYPDDGILGEEYGASAAQARTWIIDPIDGTKNYLRGVPIWATLIALQVDAHITLGVVSAPALGRRWWAERGQGAWVRDASGERQLQVSSIPSLAEASISISDPIGWPPGTLGALQDATWRCRGYGDFWSHVLVAEGAVDIAAEPKLEVYDMAAFIPIVQEAGGIVTGWRGGEPTVEGNAVTTNGLLHNQVIAVLNP